MELSDLVQAAVLNGQPATTSTIPSLFRSPATTVVGPVTDAAPRVQASMDRVPNTGASGATVPSFRNQKTPPLGEGADPVPIVDSTATMSRMGWPFLKGSVLVYVAPLMSAIRMSSKSLPWMSHRVQHWGVPPGEVSGLTERKSGFVLMVCWPGSTRSGARSLSMSPMPYRAAATALKAASTPVVQGATPSSVTFFGLKVGGLAALL